jgi:hypothetical protein
VPIALIIKSSALAFEIPIEIATLGSKRTWRRGRAMTRALVPARAIRAWREGQVRGIVIPMGGQSQFPLARYAGPIATGTGSGGVAVYAAEQAASQLPFWAHLPWTAVVIFAGGWLFGLLFEDLRKEDSQLRVWWRWKRAFVEFKPLYSKTVWYDRGEDHGGSLAHASVILPICFRKQITVDAISVTGYVYRFSGQMPITEGAWAMHPWKVEIGRRFLRGDVHDLALAHIPYDFGHPGYYNTLGSDGYFMSDGTGHVVFVELIAGKRTQSKKLLFLLPSNRVAARESTIDPGGRFFVFEEDNALFPPIPCNTSALFRVDRA